MTDRLLLLGRRALIVLALVALTAWLTGLPQTPAGGLTAIMLGFSLLAAYIAGGAAAAIGLPRVTGYVLIGIAVGPFALEVLSADMVEDLRTIDELALALIALTAGGELKIKDLRRMLAQIVGVSIAVLAIVVTGISAMVILARPLLPLLADRPLGFTVAVALLLGIWCANSSPDATIAVINETGSRGPVTETILGVTVFKDVLVIIAFAAALSFAGPLVQPDANLDASVLATVAWEVGGALVLGALAGWGFSLYLVRIGVRSILATLIFTFVLTIIAHELHVELLLLAIAAGFVIENFSQAGDQLLNAVEANAIVVFALFFALAGAALDLGALAEFWAVALVVVVARLGLTWAGVWAAGRVVALREGVSRLAWRGLISQAGVTLGLSLLVQDAFPDWGGTFVAVTAAVIIVHLLVGPVLLKTALLASGEAHGRQIYREASRSAE
ncbi:MAG: cation:proton antiporter [Gemmatimonadota bacterium]